MFLEGLAYDDVLLVPKYSEISSRKDVSTETFFSRRIKLQIPLVSSLMDTVTESRMAIAMAQMGGLGLIHRFMSVEDEVREVLKVKRYEGLVVEDPYTIAPDKTLKEAVKVMGESGVTGLLVVDTGRHLLGILTHRDVMYEKNDALLVSELMTARERMTVALPGTNLEEAKAILKKAKVEKLPLVNGQNVLKGLITSTDLEKIAAYPLATKDQKGRLRVGAAIGAKDDLERAKALIDAGADVLVIDVANGHAKHVMETVRRVRDYFGDIELVAGNVATAEGMKDLISWGVDGVRVGIGPGGFCTTRIVAGVGVPLLTSLLECSKVAAGTGVTVIADGGTRHPGDVTKAVAAGADAIMLGTLLTGTDEAPGLTVMKNGKKYKIGRGMASFGANYSRRSLDKGGNNAAEDYVPEGVETLSPYKGSARDVIHQLVGGLRSGMSYCNARTVKELRQNATFMRMTGAGLKESNPHAQETLG